MNFEFRFFVYNNIIVYNTKNKNGEEIVGEQK